MFYLFNWYWSWILLALLLGIVVGLWTFSGEIERSVTSRIPRWLKWATILFLVGFIIALFKWFPGRSGLYLETALLLFAPYIIGCFAGGLLATIFGWDKRLAAAAAGSGGVAASTALNTSSAEASKSFSEVPSFTPVIPVGQVPVVPAVPITPEADTSIYPGTQPVGISAPREDGADDLKLIKGIGPKNEEILNRLGIYHFDQIAKWTPDEATWVGHHIAFPGRIEREHWIEQAELLSTGIDTDFSAGVKAGTVTPDDTPLSESEAAHLRTNLSEATSKIASVAPAIPVVPVGQVPLIPAVPTTPEADTSIYPGTQPVGISAPRDGAADDLKLIKGIGPKNEEILNRLGIYHFDQIAQWTPDEATWVGHHIAFPGRIEHEHWIEQAKLLSTGIDTDYSAGVKAGTVTPDDAPLNESEAAHLRTNLSETRSKIASVAPAIPVVSFAPVPLTPPVPTTPEADTSIYPGTQPVGISAPRDGAGDDLKLIKGIGPKNEGILNRLGIYHFDQIAQWTPDEATWVGHHIAFPGRIEREHWIEQAKLLSAGVDTDYSTGVRAGTLTPDDAPLSESEVANFSLPEAAPALADEGQHHGNRPLGIAEARAGSPDNLKLISGIGPVNERRLHQLGIWHFSQVAAWTHENVKWVGSYLAFPGRIEREHWVEQAKQLVHGRQTKMSRRAAEGLVDGS
jgi:predicted flap endonuclease-1-like 5' DNA nuclease